MAAINNLSDGHPMKENMDFCKAFSGDEARRPIFDLSDVTPDNILQTRLKEFFIDNQASPLYSTLNAGGERIDERSTLLIRNFGDSVPPFKNLYQVLEYSLRDEWTAFFNSPLCRSLFSSNGDYRSAVIQGQDYNENLIKNLEGILKPDLSKSERVQGESIEQLNKFENWRTTRKANADTNDYSLISTGGVTTFFENVFDFKSPKPVRNMFEHPDAASQCKQIYGALGYKIVENPSPAELGPDPDGLAYGRKPLYWQRNEDGAMVAPVTCYICECYLYTTEIGMENNMECEHYFPFLEAQLFWGLHMPDNIKKESSGDRLKFLKREYGPVCRLCNGSTHKTGLAMIKMNGSWGGGAGYNQKYKLNDFAINRIARDTDRRSPGSHTFNRAQREQRLKYVFTPLLNHINYELRNVSARRVVEILMLRYFYHLNDRTLKKIYGAYLNGEDISKKEKERKKFVKMIKKTHRRLRMVEHGVSKGFNKFTKFVLGKKREYDNIGNSIIDRARAVFRRSKRTQKLIEEKKAKANAELAQIETQKSVIAKMMAETQAFSNNFATKYGAIIENPENNMFETLEEEAEYKSELDSLCKKNNAIVRYFMSNNIQKGGMIPISDPILFVDRKYEAYVIIEGFTRPVLALMGGYLKFLNACNSYITESINSMNKITPKDLFENIYNYENEMYEYQLKMDAESAANLSILNIFSYKYGENPYAYNEIYSDIAQQERVKFMEANNNLVSLLKNVDIACKPFQPPSKGSPYSQNINKYCNIKIKELKDSIVRGKKFDLMVDYFADKRAHPEASSGGEAKDEFKEAKMQVKDKVKSFTEALDSMITKQGQALPSYLLDRWMVSLEGDEENIKYLDTIRNYLDNIYEKDKITIKPEYPDEIGIADADDDDDEDDDGGGGGGASKKSVADEEYRKSRYEMITETEGEFKMFGQKYKKAFPHIKEKIDSFINTEDVDNFKDVDNNKDKDEDAWIRAAEEEEAAAAATAAAAAAQLPQTNNMSDAGENVFGSLLFPPIFMSEAEAEAAAEAAAVNENQMDLVSDVEDEAPEDQGAAAAPPGSPRRGTQPTGQPPPKRRSPPPEKGGSRRKRIKKKKRKTLRIKNKKRKKKTRRKRKSN